MIARIVALVERRAARRRAEVAAALRAAGVDQVAVEGEAVRASGRGLMARWMGDARLRDAGRGEA